MSENIRRCPDCSFKCVESQIYKNRGNCPREKCKFVWKDIQTAIGV